MLGELPQDRIEELLWSRILGRIGCHADGMTYVVPVTYVYDGESVYGHTRDGLKVRMMRQNPAVCFQVDKVDSMAAWESVIAQGRFEELDGKDADRALSLIVDRLLPLMSSETSMPSHGLQHIADAPPPTPVLYRIRLLQKTGRCEKR